MIPKEMIWMKIPTGNLKLISKVTKKILIILIRSHRESKFTILNKVLNVFSLNYRIVKIKRRVVDNKEDEVKVSE